MNEPPTLDFDFDTMTLAQALPWFMGVAMILIGGLVAGLMWLCGCSLDDFKRPTGSLGYEN